MPPYAEAPVWRLGRVSLDVRNHLPFAGSGYSSLGRRRVFEVALGETLKSAAPPNQLKLLPLVREGGRLARPEGFVVAVDWLLGVIWRDRSATTSPFAGSGYSSLGRRRVLGWPWARSRSGFEGVEKGLATRPSIFPIKNRPSILKGGFVFKDSVGSRWRALKPWRPCSWLRRRSSRQRSRRLRCTSGEGSGTSGSRRAPRRRGR